MASKLSKEAIEARRAYGREWNKKNPERKKRYNTNYWNKKGRENYQKKMKEKKALENKNETAS